MPVLNPVGTWGMTSDPTTYTKSAVAANCSPIGNLTHLAVSNSHLSEVITSPFMSIILTDKGDHYQRDDLDTAWILQPNAVLKVSDATDAAGVVRMLLKASSALTAGADRWVLKLQDAAAADIITVDSNKLTSFLGGVSFAIAPTLPAGSYAIPAANSVSVSAPTLGAAATFARSDATYQLSQAIAPTWTAVHTYSAQDVHNAGVSLGTSGRLDSSVANAGVVYDLRDQIGAGVRTSGTLIRVSTPSDSRTMMDVTWDGRFGFGYSGSPNIALSGNVLSFVSSDSVSPAGAPVYQGIFGSVSHQAAAETVPILIGITGQAVVQTATGLNAVVVNGVTGSVGSNADSSMSGKVLSCLTGAFSQGGQTGSGGVTTKDITFGMNLHPKGLYDHLTVLWCPNFSLSNSTGYPATNRPGISSSVRATIQDWGATTTAASPVGEYWALRGEHINGSIATYPAHTGYLRMVYPRRTGGTGVHAMHAWWEPWPNTATIRGGALDGDTYFDDGTNFSKGLWEYAGAWYKLLQHKSVDAISGAAAPAILALTTGGATGPTVAAQNTWLQVVGANGTAYWVPAWI